MAFALAAALVAVPTAGATFPGHSGLIAFASQGKIFTMRADGSGLRKLIDAALDDLGPSWSPDGIRIAFTRTLTRSNTEIYVMRAGSTGVRRLTRHAREDEDPAWTPDGRRIALARRMSRDGVAIAVMNTDGTHVRVLVSGDFNAQPSWSPDGKRVAFARDRGFGTEIWVVRADGTGLRQLTRRRASGPGCEQDSWPGWAPDGKAIVFGRLFGNACELSQLYTIRPDGLALKTLGARNLVFGGPRYSPDGRSIAAVGPGGASLVILTSRGRQVRSIPVEGFAGPPSWQSVER